MKTIQQIQREEITICAKLKSEMDNKEMSNGEVAEINLAIMKSIYLIDILQREIETSVIKNFT